MLNLWQISRKIDFDSATQFSFQTDLKEWNTCLAFITVVLGQGEDWLKQLCSDFHYTVWLITNLVKTKERKHFRFWRLWLIYSLYKTGLCIRFSDSSCHNRCLAVLLTQDNSRCLWGSTANSFILRKVLSMIVAEIITLPPMVESEIPA